MGTWTLRAKPGTLEGFGSEDLLGGSEDLVSRLTGEPRASRALMAVIRIMGFLTVDGQNPA